MTGYDLAPITTRTTGRGFDLPTTAPDWHRHKRETVVSVRLTQYERELLRMGRGVYGKFVLMPADDNTFELVRVTP